MTTGFLVVMIYFVAVEIIHTVIGSFGLVSVALFTALRAGMMLAKPIVK